MQYPFRPLTKKQGMDCRLPCRDMCCGREEAEFEHIHLEGLLKLLGQGIDVH